MFSLLTKLRGSCCGVAAVEFALITPIILLVTVTVVELGRSLAQAQAVEKGMRAGAMLAARSDFPISANAQLQVTNIVQTGTIDGSGALVAAGWAEPGAQLTISFSSATVDGETIPVVRLQATVPYDLLMPGLIANFGLGQISIDASHEQVHIGN